ncbi:hypothetical protein G7B40_020690 [Aetokthonos hydrillicola Thurmond2011]|jgi:hypothetical protein|uniref:Uncharacterized protein n=1 Tax=Aetokthonos hydrillicola Thurmond2011 TaxID=2712845 RepID=A0AAP5IBB6_9CYAN|nr:hypothetical protein [Aetokthonos hydrillicola CCALA 1050]MDR9896967.1 hypothetical protein [Aetokthonos hydrillicola Thurmond2011]
MKAEGTHKLRKDVFVSPCIGSPNKFIFGKLDNVELFSKIFFTSIEAVSRKFSAK